MLSMIRFSNTVYTKKMYCLLLVENSTSKICPLRKNVISRDVTKEK